MHHGVPQRGHDLVLLCLEMLCGQLQLPSRLVRISQQLSLERAYRLLLRVCDGLALVHDGNVAPDLIARVELSKEFGPSPEEFHHLIAKVGLGE